MGTILYNDPRTVVKTQVDSWMYSCVGKCGVPILGLWDTCLLLTRLPDVGQWGGDAMATESGVHRRKMRSREVIPCFVPNNEAEQESTRDLKSRLSASQSQAVPFLPTGLMI